MDWATGTHHQLVDNVWMWITRRKKLIAVFVALALVVLTPLFARLFHPVHEANVAFVTFGNALVAKDYHLAYALTHSDFRAITSESAFVSQQTALCSNLGDLKQVKRGAWDTGEHEDGWTADITATFVFAHAERVFDFKMKKEGVQWKVFGYRER